MSSATLNLRVQPRRMLEKADAAAYCAIPAKRFETECPIRPIALPGGKRAYDMRDLDQWIDALKGGDADDADTIVGKLG